MGQLPICYALSRLSIVAGSFEPHVGGHNILEPCLYDLPVLFGPYMFTQKELVRHVLGSKAGIQVTYDTVRQTVAHFFDSPQEEMAMRFAAQTLQETLRGSTEKTAAILHSFLE